MIILGFSRRSSSKVVRFVAFFLHMLVEDFRAFKTSFRQWVFDTKKSRKRVCPYCDSREVEKRGYEYYGCFTCLRSFKGGRFFFLRWAYY